ncbi:MAG: hypothetical protein ACRCUT_01835, partial [Spirochaetota bacterium]
MPVLLLYIGTNINLDSSQMLLLFKCTVFAVAVSIPTTLLNHLIVLKPIARVFRHSLAGKEIDEKEYAAAQRRFFKLPLINGIGSAFRWIAALALALIPMYVLSDITFIQRANLSLLFFTVPFFGGILYFYLTEIFIQGLLSKGIFVQGAQKSSLIQMSFMRRLFLSNAAIIIITIAAISVSFLVIIYQIKPDFELP